MRSILKTSICYLFLHLPFRTKIANIKGIKSRNLETQRVWYTAIRWKQAEAITNWRERHEKIKHKQEGSKNERQFIDKSGHPYRTPAIDFFIAGFPNNFNEILENLLQLGRDCSSLLFSVSFQLVCLSYALTGISLIRSDLVCPTDCREFISSRRE